jgi:hypothetical protein
MSGNRGLPVGKPLPTAGGSVHRTGKVNPGLAPEALHERECSCRGFSRDPPACGVLVSTGISNVPVGLGGATRT